MYRLLFVLAIFLFPHLVFAVGEGQRIDLGVSPIRHEMSMDKGTSLTKTIKFLNNADVPYDIYLTTEDCEAAVDYGTPKCSVFSGAVDPLHLSTWVHFTGPTRFTVPPKSDKEVTFTITAPQNATAGGHYAAVFFNNPDTTSAANTVKMIRRIGTLLLVTVNGAITYDTSIGNIQAVGPGGAGGGVPSSAISPGLGYPTQPIWTLSALTDLWSGKIDMQTVWKNSQEKFPELVTQTQENLNPLWSAPELPKQPFLFQFSVPLSNSGTTHSRPTGRVELFDDQGNLLKSIGKESIKSPEGVFLGEKIVDYLPINDEDGNILPGTSRVFLVDWQGFAYQGIEDGKTTIRYQTPGEFYSQSTTDSKQFLWPWERLFLVKNQKTFHAQVSLEYRGEKNKLIPLSTSMDVPVEYFSIQKGLNNGLLILIGLIVFLVWWILGKKKHRNTDVPLGEVYQTQKHSKAKRQSADNSVDELEKAKELAQIAIAKKQSKKAPIASASIEIDTPKRRIVKKVSLPAEETLEKTDEILTALPVKKSRTSKKVPVETPENPAV